MEITKEMYEKIAHLFPKQKSPPKISNLEALNAILHILENGSKWRSLGKNWHTIYTRANRWAKKMESRVKSRIYGYYFSLAYFVKTFVKMGFERK